MVYTVSCCPRILWFPVSVKYDCIVQTGNLMGEEGKLQSAGGNRVVCARLRGHSCGCTPVHRCQHSPRASGANSDFFKRGCPAFSPFCSLTYSSTLPVSALSCRGWLLLAVVPDSHVRWLCLNPANGRNWWGWGWGKGRSQSISNPASLPRTKPPVAEISLQDPQPLGDSPTRGPAFTEWL